MVTLGEHWELPKLCGTEQYMHLFVAYRLFSAISSWRVGRRNLLLWIGCFVDEESIQIGLWVPKCEWLSGKRSAVWDASWKPLALHSTVACLLLPVSICLRWGIFWLFIIIFFIIIWPVLNCIILSLINRLISIWMSKALIQIRSRDSLLLTWLVTELRFILS